MIFRFLFLQLVFLLTTVAGFCQSREINLEVPLLRGQVFQKAAGDHLFSISAGKIEVQVGSTVLTGVDGVVFLKSEAPAELRLREESALAVKSSASFEFRMGTTGILVASSPVELSTPHLRITLQQCIAVIKVNPVLTRVCVVKGQVSVWKGRDAEKIVVPAGQEIAAAQGRISNTYASTDDLRYTWYWNSPDQEPSLK